MGWSLQSGTLSNPIKRKVLYDRFNLVPTVMVIPIKSKNEFFTYTCIYIIFQSFYVRLKLLKFLFSMFQMYYHAVQRYYVILPNAPTLVPIVKVFWLKNKSEILIRCFFARKFKDTRKCKYYCIDLKKITLIPSDKNLIF